MEKKYKIKYLPLFYNDLDQITDYIMYKLNNEIAANNFVNKLENEIKKIILSFINAIITPNFEYSIHPIINNKIEIIPNILYLLTLFISFFHITCHFNFIIFY